MPSPSLLSSEATVNVDPNAIAELGVADKDRLRWVAPPYPRNPNLALSLSVTFFTCCNNKRTKIYLRERLRAHFARLFALSVYLGSLGAPRSLARLAK